jgi:hypothetical protein
MATDKQSSEYLKFVEEETKRFARMFPGNSLPCNKLPGGAFQNSVEEKNKQKLKDEHEKNFKVHLDSEWAKIQKQGQNSKWYKMHMSNYTQYKQVKI